MKKIAFLVLVAVLTACSQNPTSSEEKIVAFDTGFIDSTVNPCQNFYQYAIGGWRANNPVPETESRWMAFNILNEENRQKLLEIVDVVRQNLSANKGTDEQMIRDFYNSAMDTAAIDAAGISGIEPILASINEASTQEDLVALFGKLAPKGVSTPVGLYIGADSKNSKMNTVYASQSGLNLPDRDYYLQDNEKFEDIRQAYVAHINSMFALSGQDPIVGESILALETKLAAISWSRLERRDPDKRYNKKNLKDWDATLDALPVEAIASGRGFGAFDTIIVGQPSFFASLNELIKSENLEDWKNYLKWNTITGFANYLGTELETENFAFYRTKLSGTSTMKPRNERVFGTMNGVLSQPLGKLFVKEYFDEESKAYMSSMIENLRSAYKDRIQDLEWMSTETKEKAMKKLNAFTYKVGYPDEWEDYSKLEIVNNSYIQNIMNAREFGYNEMLEKLGKPVDKTEWGMSPQTVNAYYSPSNNEIVFPAGILQPPFFHKDFDHAINYGGIGAVIGHEFSHGFDDQGSKFDWDGNLNSWWTDEDRSKFDELAQKLGEQYDGYSPVDSMYVNGKMTMGENIADLGGVTLAYEALQKQYEGTTPGDIDGFTWQQRFFLGWANVWKGNIKEQELVKRLKSDVHSPAEYRVIGPLVNFGPYYDAFGTCETGSGMHKHDSTRIKIW
ncbi:MAG: M13 family metallopeptidase [Bacteroidia bacterium]|jgi:putative endopeptidase|nr:M13 family metallopeptidase [Bacteroidia bacterium]